MSKHTPGPWFVPPPTYRTLYVEARVGNGMLQEVAACGPTEDPAQQAANARLIAAAPELLDACKAALSDDQPYIEKCRAAIAKATGENT